MRRVIRIPFAARSLAVAVFTAGMAVPACSPSLLKTMNDAEEQIFAEVEAFAEAWSRGDAAAAASFFTDDAVRVGAFGDVQRGRGEIEAAYERLMHQTMPGARLTQERGEVRMLSAELALWQGAIEITPAGGGAPLRGHVVQVMRKVKGRWLILEAHPKLFPPPPSG
jgi:uncharacterized protein (TIGR02246 family)